MATMVGVVVAMEIANVVCLGRFYTHDEAGDSLSQEVMSGKNGKRAHYPREG